MKKSPLTRKTPMKRTEMARGTATLTVKVKLRKCANPGCGNRFEKRSMTHRACSPACAVLLGVHEKRKAERKEDAARREKLKTRSDYLREAQIVFNAFRREWCRLNGFTTCPCCDLPLDWISNNVDAGHYRSVGSAPHMRFTENNVWAQRKQCNRYGAGRAVDYRIGLIARIGLAEVEALEADQAPRKWTTEELRAIKATYKAKLKELQNKPEREAA